MHGNVMLLFAAVRGYRKNVVERLGIVRFTRKERIMNVYSFKKV